MPKLPNPTDWYRLARAQAALESVGAPITASVIARHTDFDESDVEATLDDPTYQEFSEQFKRRRFGMWAESLSKAGVEIQHVMKRIGMKAILAVEDLLDSGDDKVRTAAARLAFDFNPEMERPVVRHEITNRFSADELQQARDIVKRLKEPSVRLPKLPSGDQPPN
jgi:hypothetical protein